MFILNKKWEMIKKKEEKNGYLHKSLAKKQSEHKINLSVVRKRFMYYFSRNLRNRLNYSILVNNK